MLSHKKTAWPALAIFLFTFSIAGVAESQAPLKDPKAAQLSKKKWRVIDGFRTSKFGMDEKQVIRAIAKDFKISKNKVERKVHPETKTTALIIHLPKLMEVGGPADIVYILGYKSKRLIRINIDWGIGVNKGVPPQEVIDAANLLRAHFTKTRYKKEGYSLNARFDDTRILVFRGKDKKDRMITLRLTRSKVKKGEDKKEVSKNVSLILSYMLDPKKADVFKAKAK